MKHFFSKQFLILGLIFSIVQYWFNDKNYKLPLEVSEETVPPEVCRHDSMPSDTIRFLIDGYDIKVPIYFTPDGDGVDDYFYPILGDESIVITSFSIFTPEEMRTARVMYGTKVIRYGEKLPLFAWNGESRYEDDTYVKKHIGPFQYGFTASTGNSIIKCRGWACAAR